MAKKDKVDWKKCLNFGEVVGYKIVFDGEKYWMARVGGKTRWTIGEELKIRIDTKEYPVEIPSGFLTALIGIDPVKDKINWKKRFGEEAKTKASAITEGTWSPNFELRYEEPVRITTRPAVPPQREDNLNLTSDRRTTAASTSLLRETSRLARTRTSWLTRTPPEPTPDEF